MRSPKLNRYFYALVLIAKTFIVCAIILQFLTVYALVERSHLLSHYPTISNHTGTIRNPSVQAAVTRSTSNS